MLSKQHTDLGLNLKELFSIINEQPKSKIRQEQFAMVF